MTNQRLPLPDFLKGIAVLLMIQVHLTELFAQESFYNNFLGKFSLFLGGVPAAPLFMVVMGFFAGYQNIGAGGSTLRGLKLIILGFMLNVGLNLHLFYRIYKGLYDIDHMPYLFGADILFLAGLSLIIIVLLNKVLKQNAVLFILTAFIVALLSDVTPYYIGDSFTIRYPLAFLHSGDWWSYFPLLPWLAYPLLGVASGILYKKQSVKLLSIINKPLFLAVLLFPFLLFIRYGFNLSADLQLYYHHGIAFLGWALTFLILIVTGCYHLLRALPSGNIIVRYLQWTGKNVTAFYIFQWLIIGNIATGIYKTQSPSCLVVWYIGIVISTSLLVLGWKHRNEVKKLFLQSV